MSHNAGRRRGPKSAARQFLTALYGVDDKEELPGSLVLWTKSPSGRSRSTDWTTTIDAALRKAQKYRQSKDVYFGVALQNQDAALELARVKRPDAELANVRGSEGSAICLPAVWVDIDVAGDGHKAKAGDLPPTKKEALDLVDVVPLPPSAVVWSGGGFHVYWIFKEPWELDTDEERQEAKGLLLRMEGAVRSAAQAKGWGIDHTADLARILRLPGSLNHKGAPSQPTKLDHLGDERYNPGDIAAVLPELPPESTTKNAPLDPGERQHAEDKDAGPPAQLKPIMAEGGCSWLRHTWEDADKLSEPEWYAALSILGRCESSLEGREPLDGQALAHKFSKRYHGYDPAETDAKLAHALKDSGPRTCKVIANELGAKKDHCEKCPHWEKIKSPIVIGRGSVTKSGKKRTREKDFNADPRAVLITEEEYEVTNQAVELIAKDPNLYQRGGMLVQVVHHDDPEQLQGKLHRTEAGPVSRPVVEARVRDIASAQCRFGILRKGKDDTWEIGEAHPPQWLARSIMGRGSWSKVRRLEGIVEAPTLRPDGSVLEEPGYDLESGLLYIPNGKFDPVPERPSEQQIRSAISALEDVVSDFPFTTTAHHSAWLASLLTPLARMTYHGPSPLNLIDANTRGVGKSLLADVTHMIIAGREFSRSSYSRDDQEMRKAITTMCVSGRTTILLDNISGFFGGATIDMALTATTWHDRLLGGNTEVELPLSATWYATGNNIELDGDIGRRVLPIRLESAMERPELRKKFEHPWLLGWCKEQRRTLLPAALTLLRGWWAAGQPRPQGMEAWGSYEAWSDVVRACIVWLGLPDPADTREDLTSEPAAVSAASFIAGLEEILPKLGGSAICKEILAELGRAESGRYPTLRSAIRDRYPKVRAGELPTAHQLGCALRKYKMRNVGGAWLRPDDTRAGLSWTVERHEPAEDRSAPAVEAPPPRQAKLSQ